MKNLKAKIENVVRIPLAMSILIEDKDKIIRRTALKIYTDLAIEIHYKI
jgi:hypothetical protein